MLYTQIIWKLHYLDNDLIQIKIIDFGKTISDDKKQLFSEKYPMGLERKEAK